jgi:hypothetical protein
MADVTVTAGGANSATSVDPCECCEGGEEQECYCIDCWSVAYNCTTGTWGTVVYDGRLGPYGGSAGDWPGVCGGATNGVCNLTAADGTIWRVVTTPCDTSLTFEGATMIEYISADPPPDCSACPSTVDVPPVAPVAPTGIVDSARCAFLAACGAPCGDL